MNTLLEIRRAVQTDLTVGDESSLYSPTTIDAKINSAYIKVAGLFNWPELVDPKQTSTESGYEYYDFPDNWRTDSMWRLEIGGEQWGELPDGSPMDYNDYLQWRADTHNANSTDKKWAVNGRKFFVFPVPTTTGDFNMSMWGQKNIETLSLDGDTTIFSSSMPEGNEAIRLEAVAILKAKGDEEQKGQFRSIEAMAMLTNAWNRNKSNRAVYEKTNAMFSVPDLFGNGVQSSRDRIGSF